MDNRGQKRFIRELKVRWKSAELQFEGVTRDVCQSGAFIATGHVVPLRHVIEIELSPGQGEPLISCLGKVIWVNSGQVETFPPGFGIEFLDSNDGLLRSISDFSTESDRT